MTDHGARSSPTAVTGSTEESCLSFPFPRDSLLLSLSDQYLYTANAKFNSARHLPGPPCLGMFRSTDDQETAESALLSALHSAVFSVYAPCKTVFLVTSFFFLVLLMEGDCIYWCARSAFTRRAALPHGTAQRQADPVLQGRQLQPHPAAKVLYVLTLRANSIYVPCCSLVVPGPTQSS